MCAGGGGLRLYVATPWGSLIIFDMYKHGNGVESAALSS